MKSIPSENYLISPFVTHKNQFYTFTYLSGGNPNQVTIDLAMVPPTASLWQWVQSEEPVNANGIFKRPLYSSIQHLFFTSGSVFTLDSKWAPTGSQFYVVGVSQIAIGEGINPGSLILTSPSSTASLYDDGLGHIVSSTATGSIIGNVFYSSGIVVIQQDVSAASSSILTNNGLFLTTGSQVNVEFDASQTIYEHHIVCTMEPGDFNYSLNPSVKATGSLSGTGKVLDFFASGTLTPYMTTVGVFNDGGELIALAKFPRPIKRATDSQQTVVIRFDA
jgi:hypothetical protein